MSSVYVLHQHHDFCIPRCCGRTPRQFSPCRRRLVRSAENNIDVSINHRFTTRTGGQPRDYDYFHSRLATSYEQGWNPNDPSNPQTLWWQPNNINPNRISAFWSYDLPFGKGRPLLNNNKALNLLAGGWTVAGNWVWSQGTLIGMPNTFYYGNVNNIKISNPTIGQMFNTAGCVSSAAQAGPGDVVVAAGQPCTSGWEKRSTMQPGTYQARIMPLYVDGVRNPNASQLNGSSLMRDFRFQRQGNIPSRFQFRGDVLSTLHEPLILGRREHGRDKRSEYVRRHHLRLHGPESVHPDSGPSPLVS